MPRKRKDSVDQPGLLEALVVNRESGGRQNHGAAKPQPKEFNRGFHGFHG
jgi:hypothetical protein